MQFDHTKDTIAGAIGMSEKHLDELQTRLAEIGMEIMTSDSPKPSHIAEKVAQELSYTDLIFVATQYLQEKVLTFNQDKKVQILKMLRDAIQDELDSRNSED